MDHQAINDHTIGGQISPYTWLGCVSCIIRQLGHTITNREVVYLQVYSATFLLLLRQTKFRPQPESLEVTDLLSTWCIAMDSTGLQNRTVDCASLATRTDFNAYAQLLLNATNGTLERLRPCRVEVCGALWGQGNSDISGIGMIVGYTLDHAFGLILSSILLLNSAKPDGMIRRILRKCLWSFRDCSVFFALSIEIAAIIVLIQEDWGENTTGMGDYTVRITQAVAMLVLLALVYPLVVFGDGQSTLMNAQITDVPKPERKAARKAADAFYIFVFCWLLDAYPFFSKMSAEFGKSKISKRPGSPGSVLDQHQFAVIENMCFQNIKRITKAEDEAMTAFVILTYIPLSIFIIFRIVWLGIERNNPDIHQTLLAWIKYVPLFVRRQISTAAFLSVPLIACGLVWSIIFTKNRQEQLANSNGGDDGDNNWTFGQIVAVTLFTPMFWECWRSAREERERSREGELLPGASSSPTAEQSPIRGCDKHSFTW